MFKRLLLLSALVIAGCLSAYGQIDRNRQVDVELVLAVDVSGSMSPSELVIQRRGYAEALKSDEVWQAIDGGLIGSIAVVYVEWARRADKKTIVPWTKIAKRDDANRVALALLSAPVDNMYGTSIAGAIDYATLSLQSNHWQGLRQIIDISGDGPNNQGGAVLAARDNAVGNGISINGLPIMVTRSVSGRGGFSGDLKLYYETCVIGGPGAFVIPVTRWEEFEEAVRRKLVLELAGIKPVALVHKAAVKRDDATDCEIGEKLRREWFKRDQKF